MNAAGILEVRPDTKGPKNLAILLFMSAFLVLFMAWQDWQLHGEGLSVNQIEVFLETPNSQPGDPTTVEQYQEFEDSVRDANGYLIRSISLFIAAGCLLIGAPLLFRLQRRGAQLCTGGSLVGLTGGLIGSVIINRAAQEHLGDALMLTYEIWVYLCGAFMGLCFAVSALPLLNARARLALQPQVVLAQEDE
jgi:hypothetical protein